MQPSKRKILRVCLIAVAVAAIAIIATPLWLGHTIKAAVVTVGPQILGVPVKVAGISVSALRGRVEIRGFEIGNPEGFDTPYLLHAEEVVADVHVRDTLFESPHIEEIRVVGPHVWYHRKLTESNVSALLANLEKDGGEEKDAEDKPRGKDEGGDKKKDEGKSIVIDNFLFDEGTVGVKMGAGVNIPLAKIELHDIGKDGSFMSAQIVRVVLGAVLDSVIHAVSAVGETAVKAVGATADAVGDAAGALIKGVGSILGGDE